MLHAVKVNPDFESKLSAKILARFVLLISFAGSLGLDTRFRVIVFIAKFKRKVCDGCRMFSDFA